MREDPKPFQVYKHFKGTYYQVITVARHSETGEKLVIYRPLFGEDYVCARPLDMFLSEVDHDKYPEVKQKWRFALATGQNKSARSPEPSHTEETEESVTPEETEVPEETEASEEPEASEETEVAEETEIPEEPVVSEETEEPFADDFLDKFLDADTYEEKLDVFTDMWKTINEDNIDNVATVMDLSLTGETLEDKYKEILNCLKMRARYESSRFR